MMNSLRATEPGLERIEQARRRKKWNKTAAAWLNQAYVSKSTLNRFWARQPIRKESFVMICQVVGVDWESIAESEPLPSKSHYSRVPKASAPIETFQDWGDAPEVEHFCGRTQELGCLQQWILQDHCRIAVVHGMGGVGKTALTSRLAQTIQTQFQIMFWRSIRNAPSPTELLSDILQFLLRDQKETVPEGIDAQLNCLLQQLRHRQCLLVIDNVESILLSSQTQAGHGIERPYNLPLPSLGRYREGYQAFGRVLRVLGESPHQSCILLTSREVPAEIIALGGDQLPVRSLQLQGLSPDDGRDLCQFQGQFSGAEDQWKLLNNRYGGNPLALKIASGVLQDLFDGELSAFLEFLSQETGLFEDIRLLLDEHFQRLSNREREVMYWLAINREPITLTTLREDLVDAITPGELIQVVTALGRRSLIERSGNLFSQQSVVMEYVLDQLIGQVSQELLNPDNVLDTLRHYALVKARSKDYIYAAQVNLILQPLYRHLSQHVGRSGIVERVHQILQQLKQQQQAAYGAGNLINLLRLGKLDLQGLDFSGLPIWQANLQGLMLKDVSFAGADLSTSVFTEVIGNILSAAFSRDGCILGTSDNGYCVRLWDVQSGRLRGICKGHQHWIRSVCFAPQPEESLEVIQLLASGSADHTIRLWDAQTGAEVRTVLGHEDEVFAVTFNPMGDCLASASGDRTIRLWDVATGRCLRLLQGHQDRVRTVAFSPKGNLLASGDEQGCLKIWNLETGDYLHEVDCHEGWVRSVAFSTDGQFLASGGNDGKVRRWNVESGSLTQEWLAHPGGVYSLTFSHQEDLLATGGADHQIRLWDSHEGSCVTTLHGHGNQIYTVTFSPDAQTLVGVSLDQTVKLWDWQQNLCLKTWRGYTDWGFPIDISQDGQFLVSGSGANTIHVWDLQTQRCLQSLHDYPALVRAVAMTSDNRLLAISGADPIIQLWDWQKRRCIRRLQGHTDWVLNLAISQVGEQRYLASCSADQSVRLWNIENGKLEQVLRGHQDQVNAVAFSSSPEASYLLASASSDHQIKLWNWESGQCLSTLEGHTHRVYGLCFHPTQSLLASSSADLSIRLWDIHSGKCLKTLIGHEGWVFAIAISPCGHYLLSGGQDQSVRLWDLDSGDCVRRLMGHRHQVYSVAFDPRGKWVASGSQDQTIRLWDLESGECWHHLSSRLYEGLDITGAQGLSLAQQLTLEELGAISRS